MQDAGASACSGAPAPVLLDLSTAIAEVRPVDIVVSGLRAPR